MPEPLRIEISSPIPGEWRVVERSHRAAESVSRIVYRKAELDELLEEMRQYLLDANIGMEVQRSRLRRLGGRLAEMVLPIDIRKKVEASSSPVEFFLDDAANNLPVELFPHGDTVLAEALPVLRHWFCENAAFHAARDTKDRLQVLIVADPAEDLPGAQKEGEELIRKLRKKKEWHPRFLGRAVTCAELSRELPDSDILHLAAHYDAGDAGASSGIVMADGLWMPAPSIHSPELVFANCCRAGLTGGRNGGLSLVGRFLQRGSLHVIAPFLPVSDEVARRFASEFYQVLLSRRNATIAMLQARKVVGPASWVYWHFGGHTVEPQEQSLPRRRRFYPLLLVPLVILIIFFVWKSMANDSSRDTASASSEPPVDVPVPPKREAATTSVQKKSDNGHSGIRMAPDAGRDF